MFTWVQASSKAWAQYAHTEQRNYLSMVMIHINTNEQEVISNHVGLRQSEFWVDTATSHVKSRIDPFCEPTNAIHQINAILVQGPSASFRSE